MSKTYTLAIIGGGSISTSFLAQLSAQLPTGTVMQLLQFEPADALGVGQPYLPDLDSVVLNTPSQALSVVAAEPDHFVEWLRRRGGSMPAHGGGLGHPVPRSVYGEYLADTYRRSVDSLRERGVPVLVVRDLAIDIQRGEDGGLSILTEHSGRFPADEAVLCIGNLPAFTYREFIGREGYFHSPYPCRQVLRDLPDEAHLGIAGTSLSAVDTIVSLYELRFKGRVTAFSRRGCLPSVRGVESSDFALKWFTRDHIDSLARRHQGHLSLRDLVTLLCKDIDLRSEGRVGLQDIVGASSNPIEYLEDEIRLARLGERHWQSVLYKANDIIDYAWHKLSLTDRQEFNARYRHVFMARRVAIPLPNAEKVLEMLKRGQLSVMSMVSGVRACEQGFEIGFAARDGGVSQTVQVDLLVNATGMCLKVDRCDHPLIRNLLQRGLAVSSEFGGVRQDFETLRLLNEAGSSALPISLLGSLSAGTFFWTNAMSVNARLAGKLADAVVHRALAAAGSGAVSRSGPECLREVGARVSTTSDGRYRLNIIAS